MTKLLTEHQVSAITGISRPLLKQWRARGRGPLFEKTGHYIRYEYDKLKSWMVDNSYDEKEQDCPHCADISDDLASAISFINSKGLLAEYMEMQGRRG